MLSQLKSNNKLNEVIFIGSMIMTCFTFSIFRSSYTDSKVYIFLNWNLFLACIPYVISTFVLIQPSLRTKRIVLLVLLPSWLLFFPNAPYILTDLFHLRSRTNMPMWFDLVLILSFAWTGLVVGFMSLWDIEKNLRHHFNTKAIAMVSVVLLFVSAFGIYVGRYLRWNSWDILSNPFGLLYDIGDRFFNPVEHSRTWGMTLFMGVFLNMVYWSFHFILERRRTNFVSRV